MSDKSKVLYNRRKIRTRFKLRENSTVHLRFSVFRSNSNIYAQLIDDSKHSTIVAFSSLDKELRKKNNNKGGNIKVAEVVGSTLAKKALEKGIKNV